MFTYEFTAGKNPSKIFTVPISTDEMSFTKAFGMYEIPIELYVPRNEVHSEGTDALKKRIKTAVERMVAELNDPNEKNHYSIFDRIFHRLP
jgi:hypothetical protein